MAGLLSNLASDLDKLNSSLGKVDSSLVFSSEKLKQFTQSMKLAGEKSSEIKKLTASLQDLSRQTALTKLKDDLKSLNLSDDVINKLDAGFRKLTAHQPKLQQIGQALATWKSVADFGSSLVTNYATPGLNAAKEASPSSSITQLQVRTHATDEQRQGMSNAIMNELNYKRAAQTANVISQYNNDPLSVTGMTGIAYDFGFVMNKMKQADPTQAVDGMTEIAHILKKDNLNDYGSFADIFARAGSLQSGDLSTFTNSAKQVAIAGQRVGGMSQEDVIITTAMANDLGVISAAGGAYQPSDAIIGFVDSLQGMQVATGKQQAEALRTLGVIDSQGKNRLFDEAGKMVSMREVFATLEESSKRLNLNPEQETALYQQAFGEKGAPFMQLVKNAGGAAKYDAVAGQIEMTKDMGQMKTEFGKDPEVKIQMFQDNLQKLQDQLMIAASGPLSSITETLTKWVAGLNKFMQSSPGFTSVIGHLIAGVIGIAVLAGPLLAVAGAVMMVINTVKLLGKIKPPNLFGKKQPPTAGDDAADRARQTAQGNKFEDMKKAKECCCCCEDTPGQDKKKKNKSQSDPDGDPDESNNKKKRRKPSRLNRRPTLGDPGGSAGGNQGSRRYRMQRDTSNGRLRDRATPPSGGNPPAGGNPGPGNAGSQSIWSRIGTGFKNFFTSPVGKGLLTAGKFAVKALPVVGAVSTAVDIGMMAYDGIKKVAPQITEKAKEIGTKVKGFFQDKFEKAKEIGSKVKDFFTQRFANPTEFKDKVSTFFKTGINKEAENAPKGMPKIGSDIVTGLWNGMSSLGGWLSKMVGNFVTQNVEVPSRLALDIHSPSRKMMEQGKYVTEGLALGMTNNAGLIKGASKQLTGQVGVGKSALAASMQTRSGAAGGGEMHIHVHPHPHQRAEEIADEVMRKLGSSSRGQMMNTGTRVNLGAF